MELGIDRFLFVGANSPSGIDVNPVPDLLEEIELADTKGIHAFAIGEHHTGEFGDSSPAVLLSAAAARTRRIRLSSGITILSVADPVRVMEDFSTLDLVSNGRAEIIAGRGAYAEAFALFGSDTAHYDALYAEKLDLLLQLRSGKPVHWQGRFRPPLNGQTSYPRPVQSELPVWVGATGSPGSFARAGQLGLPLALGAVGGSIARLRPLVDLYREEGLRAGHDAARLKVAFHAIGFVGETSSKAREAFYPAYHAVFDNLARRAGRPSLTRGQFDAMTGPGESILVGDEQEVMSKIREINQLLGGISRVSLQMTVGPLARAHRLGAIERLAEIGIQLEQQPAAARSDGEAPDFPRHGKMTSDAPGRRIGV